MGDPGQYGLIDALERVPGGWVIAVFHLLIPSYSSFVNDVTRTAENHLLKHRAELSRHIVECAERNQPIPQGKVLARSLFVALTHVLNEARTKLRQVNLR